MFRLQGVGDAIVRQRKSNGAEPQAIRELLQGLLKVNGAPVPGRDFHLVMNQTVDVTGDTATGFSRGTWVVTDPEKKLRISIIANYYDQFVREGGRWKFKRHQIGGRPRSRLRQPIFVPRV